MDVWVLYIDFSQFYNLRFRWHMYNGIFFIIYPVLCPKLTLIQPTWSAYPYPVSLGFRQKPSDTALLSVITLTTFNCIVSTSVTKGAFVCFVVTVYWWRHRTNHDVTETRRALRNILTGHLNNGATRADLRGIPKHYEETAIFFITRYGINPYPYSGFLWARCSPLWYWTKGRAFGPQASLDRRRQLAWQATSYKYR